MTFSKRKQLGAALIWASVIITISYWYFGLWQITSSPGLVYWDAGLLLFLLCGGFYFLFSKGKKPQ